MCIAGESRGCESSADYAFFDGIQVGFLIEDRFFSHKIEGVVLRLVAETEGVGVVEERLGVVRYAVGDFKAYVVVESDFDQLHQITRTDPCAEATLLAQVVADVADTDAEDVEIEFVDVAGSLHFAEGFADGIFAIGAGEGLVIDMFSAFDESDTMGATGVNHAGRKPTNRERMVTETVQGLLLPNHRAMQQSFGSLTRATKLLAADPSAESLAAVRTAWRAAFLAWKRVDACPAGPISDLRLQSQIHFWPTRPSVIETTLRTFKTEDETDFASLSVAAKGLAGMEYLLFSGKSGELTDPKSPDRAKRAHFLIGLAEDLTRVSSEITAAWRETETTLASGGQQSINEIANHLIFGVEVLAMNRLRPIVALHTGGRLRPDYIEGGISDTSQTSALATLESARAVFRGGEGYGFADYLRDAGQDALRARIERDFERTISSLKALGQPLEDAVKTDQVRVQRLQSLCKELEISLKVDLGSRLGITLMFGLNDGD